MKTKILLLNLLEGGIYWENITRLIQRENPDILCLQEVFDGDIHQPANFQSIARLRALLPHYYYYFSPELFEIWPQGQGDQGNAVFSRFPIVDKKTISLHGTYKRLIRPPKEDDFSHYPKNLQHVVIPLGGEKLHVFNMHGIWGREGGDTPERLRMSNIIVNAVKEKDPAVLVGDFNLKPNTKTISSIEKHMTSVFKNDFITTFNMKHKTNPGYATAVVDMFFVSPHITVVSKSSPGDDVSDHLPFVVTIET